MNTYGDPRREAELERADHLDTERKDRKWEDEQAAKRCGPTHYTGCDCHESRRDTEIADLREKLANVIYDLADERALADRLGNALEQCAEDSEELLGERAWWAMEKRCRYQERYLETVGNKERALLAIKAWKEARHGKA